MRFGIVVLAGVGAAALAWALLNPAYARVPFASRPTLSAEQRERVKQQSAGQTASQMAPAGPSENRDGRTSTRATGTAGSTRVRLRFLGEKLEVLGIGWFLMLFAIALVARQSTRDATREATGRSLRFGFYVFCLSVIGLAGVFWALYQVSFIPRLVATEYWVSIVAAIGIFFLAAASRFEVSRALLGGLASDIRRLATSAPFWLACVLFVTLVGMSRLTVAASQRPRSPAEFKEWYARQPRVRLPIDQNQAKVQVVTFQDYQCPACKTIHDEYRPVFERLNQEASGSVQVVVLDYPLEQECNPYVPLDRHPAACEAAAALRLARDKGRRQELEAWLWQNQASLTPASVRWAAATVGLIEQFDTQYAQALADIRHDVEIGHSLGVRGTPTFFLNGVRLLPVSRAEFEIALRYELMPPNSAR